MSNQSTEQDQKKKIVNNIVSELMKEDESLYYTPTIEICRLIHEKIRDKSLNYYDLELVQDLSIKDIQILLSYSSSCC